MSFLDRIATCRRWDPEAYRPFLIGDQAVGRVRHELAERLRDFPSVFLADNNAVRLNPALGDFAARTRAVEDVVLRLVETGEVGRWRDEHFPVLRRWGETPLMAMDRGAVPDFGVRGFGVHMNGLVESPDGLMIWVARRSRDTATAPGKLDHLVAGGQPHGLGILENLVKECAEEAAMPRRLAEQAVAVGALSYRCERSEGLRDDVLFCFDLQVPEDFAPVNVDGKVESFALWPVEEAFARARDSEDFKFNVSLVLIHLMVRRGYLRPDDPDYHEIVEGLWLD